MVRRSKPLETVFDEALQRVAVDLEGQVGDRARRCSSAEGYAWPPRRPTSLRAGNARGARLLRADGSGRPRRRAAGRARARAPARRRAWASPRCSGCCWPAGWPGSRRASGVAGYGPRDDPRLLPRRGRAGRARRLAAAAARTPAARPRGCAAALAARPLAPLAARDDGAAGRATRCGCGCGRARRRSSLVAFAAMALLIAFSPDVWNTEKPMDAMLMTAIQASSSFPPQDAVDGGGDGQLLLPRAPAAGAARAPARARAGRGYNLAVAGLFALAASAAFTLAGTLWAAAGVRSRGRRTRVGRARGGRARARARRPRGSARVAAGRQPAAAATTGSASRA